MINTELFYQVSRVLANIETAQHVIDRDVFDGMGVDSTDITLNVAVTYEGTRVDLQFTPEELVMHRVDFEEVMKQKIEEMEG